MKNLNFSFALILAFLVAGTTIATKANFGKRVVTVCFTQIEVQDASGSFVALNTSPVRTCADARSQVGVKPIVRSAVISTAFPSTSCPSSNYFCCAKVTEISVSDPLYASAPFLDLGEGMRKYKIVSAADVFCKLLP